MLECRIYRTVPYGHGHSVQGKVLARLGGPPTYGAASDTFKLGGLATFLGGAWRLPGRRRSTLPA